MLGVILGGVCSSPTYAAPHDFDLDGISDLVSVTSSSGGVRTWTIIPSSDPGTPIARTFGLSTDLVAPSSWLVNGVPTLGIVRSGTPLVWKALVSEGVAVEEQFARAGSLLLTGADFDGDGFGDAAAVRNRGGSIVWSITRNLFQDQPTKLRTFTFGRNGARAFFMSFEGGEDWVGVIESRNRTFSKVRIRNLKTNRTKRFLKLPRFLTRGDRPRPFPIRTPEGVDCLGFVRQDGADTTLSVYKLDGTEVNQISVVGLATVVAGEFNLSDPGWEVIFQIGSQIRTYNPFSGASTVTTGPSGTLVASVNAGTVS